MINGEGIRMKLQNNKLDKKWLKVYKKSDKAGDVSSLCIGAGGDRCEVHMTKFQNGKYNNTMSFDYIRERLFAMRIAEWDYDD